MSEEGSARTPAQIGNRSFVSDGHVERRLPRPTKKMLIIFVATVLAAVGGFLVYTKQFKKPYKTVCSEEVIETASRALKVSGPDRIDRIKRVTNTIIKDPNYRKDPNCLYPLLQQRIAEGDYTAAKELFTQLESVLQGGLSPKYETDRNAVLELGPYIEKMQAQTNQNVLFLYPGNRAKENR